MNWIKEGIKEHTEMLHGSEGRFVQTGLWISGCCGLAAIGLSAVVITLYLAGVG